MKFSWELIIQGYSQRAAMSHFRAILAQMCFREAA